MRTKCNRMDLIKNLNLWGNDLEDISVLQYMPNLEVLSLSVNCVSSLADLKYCPKLSELYLRKNDIHDLAEVLNLRQHRQMKVLWLSDNPCATLPYYRLYVLRHLPGLTKLDSLDVTDEERRQAVEADLGGVQTDVADMLPDDAPSPDAAFHDRRRSAPPELPFEMLEHSNSGVSEEDRGDVSKSSINSREARSRRSPANMLDAEYADMSFNGRSSLDQHASPSERSPHGGAAPSRSGEFGRGDFAPASRTPQARPVAISPNAASPQWQQQQRRQSGASVSSTAAADREIGLRGSDQAWSQEQAHERAYVRGDLRGGPATRSSTLTAANRSIDLPASRSFAEQASPASRSFSDDGDASPVQPLSATDNILCAVLALIKELDSQGLELVRRAVEQRHEDALDLPPHLG